MKIQVIKTTTVTHLSTSVEGANTKKDCSSSIMNVVTELHQCSQMMTKIEVEISHGVL